MTFYRTGSSLHMRRFFWMHNQCRPDSSSTTTDNSNQVSFSLFHRDDILSLFRRHWCDGLSSQPICNKSYDHVQRTRTTAIKYVSSFPSKQLFLTRLEIGFTALHDLLIVNRLVQENSSKFLSLNQRDIFLSFTVATRHIELLFNSMNIQ